MTRHIVVSSALLAVLAGAGCGTPTHTADTSPLQVLAKPVVVVEKPVRQTMRNGIELPADVSAWQEARLFAKVAGYLKDIKVDKGDAVVKGELLATIDSPETAQAAVAARESANASQATIMETQAQIAKAESQVDQMSAEILGARARQSQAEATVLKAQGDVGLARATYHRLKTVHDRDAGLIAMQDVDVAAAGQNDAEARLLAARQDVVAAQESVLEAKTKRTAAERQVVALQVQTKESGYLANASDEAAQRATTMLSYTEIRAPFTGQVTARYVDPGALVQDSANNSQESAKPVVSVSDFHVVRVYLQVPESDLATVHVHTPASIRVDEIPNRVFRGSVTRMSGQLELNTRSMLTEIDLPNADRALHPGMLVHVNMALGNHPNTLTVPLTALTGDGDTRQVYVVENAIAHRRTVTLGFTTPESAEVTRGLKSDDEVVVTGKENLQDGAEVTVQQAPMASSTASR